MPIRNVSQKVAPARVSVGEAQQSRLLSLPAELRNKIYRLSLLESRRIMIGSAYPLPSQPGLLQTCRQLRLESSNIYYKENRFRHIIVEFDSRLYRKWYQSSRKRAKCHTSFHIYESKKWSNLMEWLEAWYHKTCRRPDLRSKGSPGVDAKVFKMARRMRDEQHLSWSIAAKGLEDMHQVLMSTDPRWT